jgi:hypothetical protein
MILIMHIHLLDPKEFLKINLDNFKFLYLALIFLEDL